ncbi:Rpn family recombination-promoting nuclease/putative transposase [Huintestinicola sp.]|uniref:Rpn family recombination-promoting nuclease/putative transposase n=1 Tax=Huintestinicola sp. TaxID=2981661 RepID=UPI002A22C380|nr:Rpn family recombination-promoting nuclease/putative transposase [Oscillospiraceae bacterium]
MSRDVVSAKLDIIFKKIFTDNKDMLHSFVADMLDVPQESISDIIITNPELPPETLSDKYSRLDLSLEVNKNPLNVEIRFDSETDYRHISSLEWAKQCFSEAERDNSAQCIIVVNINAINESKNESSCAKIASVIDKKDNSHRDMMTIHDYRIYGIDKYLNTIYKLSRNADNENVVNFQTSFPVIQKAIKTTYDMSEDTKIREYARMREKALHDEASALKNAKAEGEAIGAKKTEEAIISKLKAYGMTDEQIKAALS